MKLRCLESHCPKWRRALRSRDEEQGESKTFLKWKRKETFVDFYGFYTKQKCPEAKEFKRAESSICWSSGNISEVLLGLRGGKKWCWMMWQWVVCRVDDGLYWQWTFARSFIFIPLIPGPPDSGWEKRRCRTELIQSRRPDLALFVFAVFVFMQILFADRF